MLLIGGLVGLFVCLSVCGRFLGSKIAVDLKLVVGEVSLRYVQ